MRGAPAKRNAFGRRRVVGAAALGLSSLTLALPSRGSIARADSGVVALERSVQRLGRSAPRVPSLVRALAAVHEAADAATPSTERLRLWREAARLFDASQGELLQAAVDGKLDFPRARTLALSLRVDGSWAERLARLEQEAAPRGIADARIEEALALHHLTAVVLSFSGRVDGRLYHRARAAYEAVVRPDRVGPDWPHARIGLATLHALVGERREARAIFARAVLDEEAPELALQLAEYRAAVGDADRAFALLELARDTDAEWPALRAQLRADANFDPLREDARFIAVLGSDE